jgi:hypothetical protein
MRLLGPRGNPQARNMFEVIGQLQRIEGLHFERYRNDAAVADLSARFTAATGRADFFVTAVAEFGGEASLTWSLTNEEVATIRGFVDHPCVSRVLDGVAARLS